MMRYVIVSIFSGILFGVMDGVINANPFALRLLEVYTPIAKTSLNIPAGIVIDLVYGFVMAGIFILLYKSLPGNSRITKGISFGLIIWFLRVAMYVVSQWMMFKIPNAALIYILFAGLAEMLILGILYGLTLESRA